MTAGSWHMGGRQRLGERLITVNFLHFVIFFNHVNVLTDGRVGGWMDRWILFFKACLSPK